MTTPTYDPKITAVLLVDPYNDFLSEGGKLWSRAKPIAEEVGLLDNLRAIMRAAREAGLAARGSSQSFSDGETISRHLNCAEWEWSVDVA